jgi:hypothetical protein
MGRASSVRETAAAGPARDGRCRVTATTGPVDAAVSQRVCPRARYARADGRKRPSDPRAADVRGARDDPRTRAASPRRTGIAERSPGDFGVDARPGACGNIRAALVAGLNVNLRLSRHGCGRARSGAWRRISLARGPHRQPAGETHDRGANHTTGSERVMIGNCSGERGHGVRHVKHPTPGRIARRSRPV